MSGIPSAPWRRFRRSPFVLFGLAVLLPSSVIAALGVRTLGQDRRLIEAQIRERLDRAAARASGHVEEELARWDQSLGVWMGARSCGRKTLPALLEQAVEEGTTNVALCADENGAALVPAAVLLYEVDVVSVLSPGVVSARAAGQDEAAFPPSSVASIQQLEQHPDNGAVAIAAYRKVLDSGDRSVRPWALHGLARTLAREGRTAEAERAYLDLQKATGVSLGGLPADFIGWYGRCELLATTGDREPLGACAQDLYRLLTRPAWRLDRLRYLEYSEQVRQWLDESGTASTPDATALVAGEEGRLALLEAVGHLRNAWSTAADAGCRVRGELRQRMAAMSPDERIALTATLAEADLDLFSTARQIPREAARRLLVRARRTGRLFSRVVEEAEP